MKDLIVVAGATHRSGLLDEYEGQLAAAGIDFHLEPLSDLPAGANSITAARRIAYIRSIAEKFSDYESIVMTDAWDVLFFGAKDELLEKLPRTVLVSAERNCYPEASLAPRFTSVSPWRYANNGMLSGNPVHLLRWCVDAMQTADQGILDQGWFNRRHLDSQLCPLDEWTDIFYVVSATQEDGLLQMKDGRPWNSVFNTFPNFFHFSGKCPVDGFRDLLAGKREAL